MAADPRPYKGRRSCGGIGGPGVPSPGLRLRYRQYRLFQDPTGRYKRIAHIRAPAIRADADSCPKNRGFTSPLTRLKRHPLLAGKEATFWHLTSEGRVENERPPDFRRCERIAWVAAIITNADDPAVKMWENERNGERRVLLWLETHEYLVVLAVRKGYTLPWTAYPVPHEHTKRKLRAEYETYKKLEPPL
jgi:hypothetical protein